MNNVLKMMRYYVLAFLLGLALRTATVSAQADQSGFISIDCGLPDNSDYVDPKTSIYYTSDSNFTNSGVNKAISPIYKTNSLEQQLWYVRSFPQGMRNCYTLRPLEGKGGKYLIRAIFMYGNYDGASPPPKFDIHLGVEHWKTIIFLNESVPVLSEIIHVLSSDYINICLVKTGSGVPFISTLELRPLNKTAYPTQFGSLEFEGRGFCNSFSNKLIRYKDDVYDRLWAPFSLLNTTTLSTTTIVYTGGISFKPPSAIMSSGCTPTSPNGSLNLALTDLNATAQFYFYMYFAELQDLKLNQSRKFNIYINDKKWYGPYAPYNHYADAIYSQGPKTGSTRYDIVINKTALSTLPPILNAIEVYSVKEFSLPQTFDRDVWALLSIKSTYEVKKNWEGDPCSPQDFIWDGVTCNKDGFDSPRVISLNLSFNGLNYDSFFYI